MGKGWKGKAIPDRWLDYQPLGKCISGTKIVAFKVPLATHACQSIPESEWFTPSLLLEKQPQLKTIIDLTNTHRYYNGQKEFGTKGIDHVKILVEGRGTIPPDSQLRRFFDVMDFHMRKYADMTDALVGVHCTHGLNRTGYFVCRWMVDRLNMDPDDAIERFNQARGHDIERQTLLDHLKTKNLASIPQSLECFSLQRNDYASPLSDATYDEPSNHNRHSRYRDRGSKHRPQRERSSSDHRERFDRNQSRRHDSNHNADRSDRNQFRRHESGMRGGRREAGRADGDTNWRRRDDRSNDRHRWTKPRENATRTEHAP